MSLAALIRSMADAGAPPEAIALAVEAIEAREAALEHPRRLARERKQRQRARDGHGTVTGQERDQSVTGHAEPPLDKKGPQTPKELNPPTPTTDANASFVPPAGAEPGNVERKAGKGEKPKRRAKPAKRAVGSRLNADWQAPPITEMPLEVQALVRQWPAGGYELAALQFRNHWLSEGRAIGAKRDWGKTWSNWLIRESTQMMRAARSGLDLTGALRAAKSPVEAEKARRTAEAVVARQAGECAEVAALRGVLRHRLGVQGYDSWMSPTLLSLDGDALTIRAASRFHLDYVERTLGDAIARIAAEQIGPLAVVRWEMLKPPDKCPA